MEVEEGAEEGEGLQHHQHLEEEEEEGHSHLHYHHRQSLLPDLHLKRMMAQPLPLPSCLSLLPLLL